MADLEAFSGSAVAEREMEALENPNRNMAGAAISPDEIRQSLAQLLKMESGAAVSDQELEAYLATLSPEDIEAIMSMSAERTTGPSTVVPMAPINPGAFGSLPSGAEMDPAMRAMANERTTGPAMAGPATMAGPAMDQNSMMQYLKMKADDIKSRMGGRQPEGSVDDYLKAMSGAAMTPEESFTKTMLGAESGAAMTPEEMQMIRGTK